MVDSSHSQLSVRRQCALLGVNRNRLTPPEPKTSATDDVLMRHLDELHMRYPTFGTRGLCCLLRRLTGDRVGRKRVRRLMQLMRLSAVYPRPRTSAPGKGHRLYPYLLRHIKVCRPDQVWCADITYIPMPKGHCYLVAIMDWYSRKVLGWAVSTTLDTDFCLRALEQALETAGTVPEIMNTDQGCQFTSDAWIEALKGRGIRISMDGKGRWLDNVFIERLWWSLKYEDIYLRSYATPRAVAAGVSNWFSLYNQNRPHSALDGATPTEVYRGQAKEAA